MEQQLQLFEHEQFGKIRVVMIKGDPWFVAVDVCRALGLTNVTKTLLTLDDDEKQSVTLPNDVSKDGVTNTLTDSEDINGALSGWIENRVNAINEPGLYRLVMRSRKPSAIKFQRWVCHEVLPAIFKTGSYSIVKPAAKREPNPNRRAGQLKAACVYVLLLSNGIIKIGQSSNIRARVAKIKRQTGLTVNDLYFSSYMSREIARLIEWACQEKFSSRRIKGEFFSVSFEEACAEVDAFAKAVATLANIERDKILVLASKDNVKLIAGRN